MFTTDSKVDVSVSSTNDRLTGFINAIPSLQRPITLNWFLSFPHISTMYSSLANFEKVNHIYYKRYVLEHSDGGNNTIDLAIPTGTDMSEDEYVHSGDGPLPARTILMTEQERSDMGDDKPGVLVIMLHGLAGGSHESYIRATINHLQQTFTETSGLIVTAYNARGCAKSQVTSKGYWNAMRTDDLAASVSLLKERYPKKKVMMVGFSLGANIMCHYLAKVSDTIDLAVAVSNPWSLDVSNDNLESWWLGRIYSQKMTAGLQKLFAQHCDYLAQNDGVTKEEVLKAKSLREFDDAFTSRVFNLGGASRYYRIASSRAQIGQIKSPLLILNSRDDPLAPARGLPLSEAKANENVALALSDYGGHIGWYCPGGRRWFAEVISEAVQGMMDGLLSK